MILLGVKKRREKEDGEVRVKLAKLSQAESLR